MKSERDNLISIFDITAVRTSIEISSRMSSPRCSVQYGRRPLYGAKSILIKSYCRKIAIYLMTIANL